MITAGVDIGSLFAKAVVIDEEAILASKTVRTSGDFAQMTRQLVHEVIHLSGVPADRIDAVGATGNGAELYAESDFVEDTLVCLSAASAFFLPEVGYSLDMGGQSITAIAVGRQGEVLNFMKNDKCASGSGRFFEVMSEKLGIPLSEVDAVVRRSKESVTISSQCGIFAESEVITHINNGKSTEAVMAAVCDSVARMATAQGSRFGISGCYTITGGVAKIGAVTSAVSRELGGDFRPFPYDPQLAAAVGAALLGDADEPS